MSKIVGLQILRGVAATLVAGFHLYAAAKVEGFEPGLFAVFAGGEIGVDIFFVISGFIIFYVSQNRPSMTRGTFLKARFWRIFPPYWAILTLYILAAWALAFVLGDRSRLPDAPGLAVSFLLLPFPGHVITIAWTLAVELLFYAVFAFTFFSGGRRRLLIAMVIWVALSQAFLFVPDRPSWLILPLHSAVLEFLFGILIAIYFLSPGEKSRAGHLLALGLGSLGLAIYLVTGNEEPRMFGREIVAGIPSALLVYGVLGLNLKRMPVLETWGESSYILYLFHILYFMIVGKAVEVLTGFNIYSSQLGMLAMLATVVVISYVATIRLERPYQNWYRRFLTPAKSPATKR